MSRSPEEEREAPPLGSWSRLYALVIGVLVVEILLLTLVTWSGR